MKTIGDIVMEHAEKSKHLDASTSEAKGFLELPDKHEFNAAGNIYSAALAIINRQLREIKELKQEIKSYSHDV